MPKSKSDKDGIAGKMLFRPHIAPGLLEACLLFKVRSLTSCTKKLCESAFGADTGQFVYFVYFG
jgi:hypothetical protein